MDKGDEAEVRPFCLFGGAFKGDVGVADFSAYSGGEAETGAVDQDVAPGKAVGVEDIGPLQCSSGSEDFSVEIDIGIRGAAAYYP